MKREIMNIIKYDKSVKYYIFALFFLLIQIFAIYRNTSSEFFSFFWYCDFASGFFALFFLMKNVRAANGLLNIGLFPQLGFVFIMLTKLIFGITLFNFVFEFPFTPFFIITTTLIHLTTLFVLIITYKVEPKIQDLYYSAAFLILLYLIIRIFTPFYDNYDFIYASQNFGFIPHYTDLWTLIAFIVVVLPTQLFRIVIYKILLKLKNK